MHGVVAVRTLQTGLARHPWSPERAVRGALPLRELLVAAVVLRPAAVVIVVGRFVRTRSFECAALRALRLGGPTPLH